MVLPESSRFQLTPELTTCRILNGMWQVSGAHGSIDPEAAVQSMLGYHHSGFTTWDMADHYGPAEEFVGEFRRRLAASGGKEVLNNVQSFTKWVPQPRPMTKRLVEEAVGVSLRRMDVEALDLLQFHWWDYDDSGYLDALAHLSELRQLGKLRHLGLTNFDTEHLSRVIDRGTEIVSNQVQYSLIDLRPEVQMSAYCRHRGVHILAYGTLCGGLLSGKYLGQPEPGPSALATASLRKYKQMVDAWGDWSLLQELLAVLKTTATKHGVSVANVAVRYILDRPMVAGVIVGARLGVTDHREDNTGAFELGLDDEDRKRIHQVTSRSQNLYRLIGDCGDEYRR